MLDQLEADLYRRSADESQALTNARAIYNGVRKLLRSEDPGPLHPIDYEDEERIAFLLVDGDVGHLVRFDPPSTTTISFLGSLNGGSYSEVFETLDEGQWRVTGFFDHERLGDDGPLRFECHPIRSKNPRAAGHNEANNRVEQLRELFRRWANAPHERESV